MSGPASEPLDYATPQPSRRGPRLAWLPRVPLCAWALGAIAMHYACASFVLFEVVPVPEVARMALFPLGYLPERVVFKLIMGNTSPHVALVVNELLVAPAIVVMVVALWGVLRGVGWWSGRGSGAAR
jgi:hypothetical protein